MNAQDTTSAAKASPNTPPPHSSSSSAPPERIGRYHIERLLGEGGFGRVYLAHDDQLHRQVAIKVPHRHLLSVEAFLAEARVLASLDHPHIVEVFDVGRTGDGLCYVVSKYIEGSDLAKKVQQAGPSLAEAAGIVATVADALDSVHKFAEVAEIVAAVADALHYAHKKGLVHRDVKPANILLDTGGKPFLADFGLAMKEEDFGKGACFTGTPAYMSPEQARGEGHRVDGRSDVFSLGVVLYELLTGRRPFQGKTRDELLEQIVTVDARPPRMIDDNIPKELECITLKAMAKRATERYTTAGDMADDLRRFYAGSWSRALSLRGTIGKAGCSVTITLGMLLCALSLFLVLPPRMPRIPQAMDGGEEDSYRVLKPETVASIVGHLASSHGSGPFAAAAALLPQETAAPAAVASIVGNMVSSPGVGPIAMAASLFTRQVEETLVAEQVKRWGGQVKWERSGQITSVSLAGTNVADHHVKALAGLAQLQIVDLSSTKVTDTGLKQLAALKDLEELDLSGSSVTDAGLKHLAAFTHLQHLRLGRNTKVTDAGLNHLPPLKHLESLDLNYTEVTDAGLEHLAALKGLKSLDLNNTKVTDAGLKYLTALKGLERLYLHGTSVTDAGLKHLAALKDLEWLDIRETKVTDAGVEELPKSLPRWGSD